MFDVCNQRTAIRFIDDVRHVYIRLRTPHFNGKVERSHRVDDQEFYQLLDKDGITDDIHLFNDKLREWEDCYNYHRPHGALGGQTPYRTAPDQNQNRSVSELKTVTDSIGAPCRTRTCDLLVRSQTLYPTELRARRNVDYISPARANKPGRSACSAASAYSVALRGLRSAYSAYSVAL